MFINLYRLHEYTITIFRPYTKRLNKQLTVLNLYATSFSINLQNLNLLVTNYIFLIMFFIYSNIKIENVWLLMTLFYI